MRSFDQFLLVALRQKQMQVLFILMLAFSFASFLIFLSWALDSPKPETIPVIGDKNYLEGVAELYSTGNRTRSFLVNNAKCQIPFLPLKPSTAFWEKWFPAENSSTSKPNVTYVDYKNVVINFDVLEDMGLGYNFSHVTCCYRTIHRSTECGGNVTEPDSQQCESEQCYPMNRVTKPISSSIHVTCNHSHTSMKSSVQFYDNFHMVAVLPTEEEPMKRKLSSWGNQSRDSDRPYNVLILGIDATSRLNAHRYLPRTLQMLRDLGAVEMRGYTKIGLNSFPNLAPLLSSHSLDELNLLCLNGTVKGDQIDSPLDDCPWIWKNFSDRNYFTAYLEDQPNVGTFNYAKTGFTQKPVDVYSRPWMKMMYNHFKTSNLVIAKQAIFLQIRNLIRVTQEHKIPFFIMSWINDGVHDYPESLGGMDVTLEQTLIELDKLKALGNTLLIVMGDHGYWRGNNRSTALGWFEDKLPLLYLRLPDRFGEPHLAMHRALRHNARQLVTVFDLHATIKQFLVLGRMRNVNGINWAENHGKVERGLSLLQKLPPRTCQESEIPSDFCACEPLTLENALKPEVELGAQLMVDYINKRSHPGLCLKVSVNHTLGYAEIGLHSNGTKRFLIALGVKPGGLKFEAVVTLNKTTVKNNLLAQVANLRRMNSYTRAHIRCLDDLTNSQEYQPFCVCKNYDDSESFWTRLWNILF